MSLLLMISKEVSFPFQVSKLLYNSISELIGQNVENTAMCVRQFDISDTSL